MSRRVLRGFQCERLAGARKAAGFSRPDLARHAGIGVATLERWEVGKSSPQIDKLAKVTIVLKISIESIVAVPPAERFPGDWRNLLGYTQPALAGQAGIETSTLGRIERGEIALSDRNAAALAGALGISIDEFRRAYERARTRPAGTPA